VSLAAYLATLATLGIPAALAVAALYALALVFGAGPKAAAAVALAYGLASLALPYATLFYGHQLAAALLVFAFALLVHGRRDGAPMSARRLLAVGVLLGGGVAVEYPGVLGLVAVGGYAAATVRPWPRLRWIALGAALPGLALAAYHTAAWGGPLLLPGHFSPDPPRQRGVFMGISAPSLDLVGRILFSETRGLFRHAPWLALAVPGVIVLARRPRLRAEAAACALAPLLYLWFNASLTTSPTDWRAGWGIGPRHLVAILPFLALGVASLFAAARGRGRAALWTVFALLVAWSATRMFVATAVRPEVPTWYDSPFHDYLFPLFRQGALAVNTIPIHTGFVHEQRQAWNLGEKMGLEGLATLVPLGAWLAATLAWLVATLRGQGDETTS
jgi:hypothetical protein